MLVEQLSVFLENKKGRLAEVTRVMCDNGIDISALSIADTADFGILRMIVNDPKTAKQTLADSGFTVAISKVIAVSVEDTPGSLSKVLTLMDENGMEVEYLYAFVGKRLNKALVILRVENAEETADFLAKNGVSVVPSSEIYNL